MHLMHFVGGELEVVPRRKLRIQLGSFQLGNLQEASQRFAKPGLVRGCRLDFPEKKQLYTILYYKYIYIHMSIAELINWNSSLFTRP